LDIKNPNNQIENDVNKSPKEIIEKFYISYQRVIENIKLLEKEINRE